MALNGPMCHLFFLLYVCCVTPKNSENKIEVNHLNPLQIVQNGQDQLRFNKRSVAGWLKQLVNCFSQFDPTGKTETTQLVITASLKHPQHWDKIWNVEIRLFWLMQVLRTILPTKCINYSHIYVTKFSRQGQERWRILLHSCKIDPAFVLARYDKMKQIHNYDLFYYYTEQENNMKNFGSWEDGRGISYISSPQRGTISTFLQIRKYLPTPKLKHTRRK